ncbi:MAG: hypothetical protein ACRC68_13350, partial [Clostridium sp.]
GYDNYVNKDIKNKRGITTIINKNDSKSGDIFKNSFVAEQYLNIDILQGAGLDMGLTSVIGGSGIDLPEPAPEGAIPSRTYPKENNVVFESAKFKSNIVNKDKILANYIKGPNHGTSLSSMAVPLDTNGGTIVQGRVGKFMIGAYEIILVNAKELVINSNVYGINENKTILICSGDIKFELGSGGSTMSKSNIFAKNIVIKTPGSLKIDEAPLGFVDDTGIITDFLTNLELKQLNSTLDKYINNWKSSISGTGFVSEWIVDEKETVYQ